jgi:hypothetical protein
MAGNLYVNIDFGVTPSTDTGTRPYTGSQPLWDNTSIFLSGGLSQTQTQVGRPTTAKVRVSNLSKQAVVDARVDAYLMTPFIGLTSPSQAVVRLRSNLATIPPGSGAPPASDPHVLECLVQTASGPQPWTPTKADLQNFGGHLCMIVNCFAEDDGAQLPDATPFAVANDQHQGQRNLSLLAGPPGLKALDFLVMPSPSMAASSAMVALVGSQMIGAGEHWLLASHPAVTVIDRKERRLAVLGPDGELVPIRYSDHPVPVDISVEGVEPGDVVKFPPFEDPLRATLRVNPPYSDEIGTVRAFDVVQRDEHGDVLGALRVLDLTTARERS